MAPNPALVKSIEKLNYRVTVGDVAARAGLNLNQTQKQLLALASDVGGNLQVADTGEIVYVFPHNINLILFNKFWRLRFQDWAGKVWKGVFYLIRISFGIVLVISIAFISLVIIAVIIASAIASMSNSDSNDSGGDFNFSMPDFFWIFSPGYESNYYQEQGKVERGNAPKKQLNFLESIFSFLFGDGNPNYDLEERRWRTVATVIKNNGGAITAEQLAPYLDNINPSNQENEDYVIPVLSRFNGLPQVSPEGGIIYNFPDLQVTAKKRKVKSVTPYLKEKNWKFSNATSGQIMWAIGLGGANIILALVLGNMIRTGAIDVIGDFSAFVTSIYTFLLAYAGGFLGIPLIRYLVIQSRNKKVDGRNRLRESRTELLNQPSRQLQAKINYSREFAGQKVITAEDITYSTERDILEQEIERLEGE
ncbi:MAG: hypothetical protein N5P05_002123 [Chroococcopsis gigantea SAG 12.99]|jgi:hypothetical protein|nr:hypothetical protein [Chlorogloea purpurea SAG 13.99]MDV3000517.1 hypothetical protein [Chroococcopsis gigantea SAG 12.99]